MHDAVVVSGARTPVGRFGGSFKDVSAPDLGAVAIKAALERAGVSPDMVGEVVLGNALQATEAGYAARLSSLRSGVPEEVPTIAINRQCSSGLEAINMAAQLVRTGEVDIVVAGGIENMSQAPYMLDYKVRFDGLRMGDGSLIDGLVEGLGCPVNRYHMGVTAENVAERFGVSREDQDEMALMSHGRAVAAIESGRFKGQIESVSVPQRRGDPVVVDTDEGPRADTTLERLAQLRPVFKKDGSVTAGNASGINDGAAAVVLMSAEKAAELGIQPKLKWHTRGVAGVEPAVMGIGPVPAVRKALGKAGMEMGDIDLVELNEAFASQALYCIRELGMDIDKTNVNGSGISLGHPVGATGAIMTVKLLDEIEQRDQSLGLVTMCVGGGQGVATIFERIN
ncbi:MAG: acetyl-CoA C-acetyltransferase [SAR202 cluster bacterium]|jgi:acetyl-CoA C-acetyltransferase|nr:acetyl-CoA C-acyltransferase [Chloroflexota bacterium]MDP6799550.1 acetyl-CoA C-acetyltransferase [SAR202 cluster bacterium]MQG67417.1 acetyl-CoA C-acetyltransferase [SAR202 cluster bacterium]HAL49282.1 acetyl-CoA C-acyltransferase [Dehalococcoidia bacterium]|tara:strand:+ start:1972 stop:3159 length:1188 start_codon:yes stop_codon:yes gene_type:complete